MLNFQVEQFVGYIIGSIFILVYLITMAIPLAMQYKAIHLNKQMFGKVPISQQVFHFLIHICIIVALFTNIYQIFAGAGFIWLIKIISNAINLQEYKAFKNKRSAISTEIFLQSLRERAPQAYISVRCWHIEVYYTTESYTQNGHTHTRRVRHERQVTTYKETRYLQVTSFFDQTPALFVVLYKVSKLIFLELRQKIQWTPQSCEIINEQKQLAYMDNRFRDDRCTVIFNQFVPGITQFNYLQNSSSLPCYMSKAILLLSDFFQFDVVVLGLLRSRIPHTVLPIIKQASLEPIILQPVYFALQESSLVAPQISQQNNQLLITDIQPPDYYEQYEQASFSIAPQTVQESQAQQTKSMGQQSQQQSQPMQPAGELQTVDNQISHILPPPEQD